MLLDHFDSLLAFLAANPDQQKFGWLSVKTLSDMPVSYKEGGVFVSAKPEMPW